MKTNDQIEKEAVEKGELVYGRMLDLENAHIEDAVRTGIRAAVVHALEQAEKR
jgi:hypothetical protein